MMDTRHHTKIHDVVQTTKNTIAKAFQISHTAESETAKRHTHIYDESASPCQHHASKKKYINSIVLI